MAQAYVTYEIMMKHQSSNREKKTKEVAVQTGLNEKVDIIYHLPNNKVVRMYYSNIYKENVVSFNISTAKSFIINKEIWKELRKIMPIIDKFLRDE